jgi:hypothetical protein
MTQVSCTTKNSIEELHREVNSRCVALYKRQAIIRDIKMISAIAHYGNEIIERYTAMIIYDETQKGGE